MSNCYRHDKKCLTQLHNHLSSLAINTFGITKKVVDYNLGENFIFSLKSLYHISQINMLRLVYLKKLHCISNKALFYRISNKLSLAQC